MMTLLIILFGILISIAGVLLLVRPPLVIGQIESHGEKLWVYVLAIGFRALLGAILIYLADSSRFPLLIEILGWATLVAAFGLTIIGWARFKRFMYWIIEKVKPAARVGGLFAVAFGVFLVYAFI